MVVVVLVLVVRPRKMALLEWAYVCGRVLNGEEKLREEKLVCLFGALELEWRDCSVWCA